jgi:hypothetical protein
MELTRLFKSFEGIWRFDRRITSLAGAPLGGAKGQAVFIPHSRMLAYREDGRHHETALEFFRHYVYAYSGDEIHVFYGDGAQTGQLYQCLIADGENRLVSREEHLCGGDRYSSVYAFADDGHFSLETKVLGARKDYVIRTDFTRIP